MIITVINLTIFSTNNYFQKLGRLHRIVKVTRYK